MCGEHHARPLPFAVPQGSSPHVRGTPGRSGVRRRLRGIIPACAGNTLCLFLDCHCVWDHPRMCGEHLFGPVMTVWFLGSSPHVRGTLMMALYQSAKKGIIPACAGNTGTILRIDKRLGDHPRMCGEHAFFHWFDAPTLGSSPHVRGTLEKPFRLRTGHGIIPACAGNTPLS